MVPILSHRHSGVPNPAHFSRIFGTLLCAFCGSCVPLMSSIFTLVLPVGHLIDLYPLANARHNLESACECSDCHSVIELLGTDEFRVPFFTDCASACHCASVFE